MLSPCTRTGSASSPAGFTQRRWNMVTFLFCVASAVCELGCIVLTLLSLILFIGGQTVGGIVFLVLAFLVSPFGVPAIAEWLVDKLHSAKFALRDFITG